MGNAAGWAGEDGRGVTAVWGHNDWSVGAAAVHIDVGFLYTGIQTPTRHIVLGPVLARQSNATPAAAYAQSCSVRFSLRLASEKSLLN